MGSLTQERNLISVWVICYLILELSRVRSVNSRFSLSRFATWSGVGSSRQGAPFLLILFTNKNVAIVCSSLSVSFHNDSLAFRSTFLNQLEALLPSFRLVGRHAAGVASWFRGSESPSAIRQPKIADFFSPRPGLTMRRPRRSSSFNGLWPRYSATFDVLRFFLSLHNKSSTSGSLFCYLHDLKFSISFLRNNSTFCLVIRPLRWLKIPISFCHNNSAFGFLSLFDFPPRYLAFSLTIRLLSEA